MMNTPKLDRLLADLYLAGKGTLPKTAEAALAEARTQLLQYIEGIIGEDIVPVEIPHHSPYISGYNERAAEQRQRLRGSE